MSPESADGRLYLRLAKKNSSQSSHFFGRLSKLKLTLLFSSPTRLSMDHPTLDHALCLGEQPNGRQCVCRRYTKKPDQREEDPDICKNCGHIESGHPLSLPPPPAASFSVTSLVKDFRDAGKVRKEPASTSELKASASVAQAETSAGLRNKRKSDTDTEPPPTAPKKSKKKGKQKVSLCLHQYSTYSNSP
jgi:hypothetical protein